MRGAFLAFIAMDIDERIGNDRHHRRTDRNAEPMSLIKAMQDFFSGLNSEEPAAKPLDTKIAAAAIAFHAIAVDGFVADVEKATLQAILMRQYDLDEDEAQSLIAEAEQRDREAVDLFAFTSVLKRNLDDDARLNVVAMLWELVYADGVVHEFEDNLVWRIAELLNISTRDRVVLRQRFLARQETIETSAEKAES